MHFSHTALWAALSLLSMTQAAPLGREAEGPVTAQPGSSVSEVVNRAVRSIGKRDIITDFPDREKLWKVNRLWSDLNISQNDYVSAIMTQLSQAFPEFNIMIHQKDSRWIETNYPEDAHVDCSLSVKPSFWGRGYDYCAIIFKGQGWIENHGDHGTKNWCVYGRTDRPVNDMFTFKPWAQDGTGFDKE